MQLRGPYIRAHVMLAGATLLIGCGGGSGSDSSPASNSQPASIAARPVEQSDLQIATALYDGTVRVPTGFYVESAPSGHAVVATSHLKNTDVAATAEASASQFELCTDDWHQALSWSETSATNSAPYSNLVATNDDDRYFEFGRVKPGSPAVYMQSRVFKCAYLNRANTNLRATGGSAGQLNVRPLTSTELRRFSEYVWQFTTYNNFGHVVLKSAGAGAATATEHTLHIASLVRGGVSASCDRIDVVAWTHRVDSATGALSLEVRTLFSFGARESAGTAQLCAS